MNATVVRRPRTGRSLCWLLTLLLLPVVPAQAADPTAPQARELLSRMANAGKKLDYEGTFIYEHGGHMQTMRIVHSADNGTERERLITLDGPSREVIRNRDTVTCILPDAHSVLVEPSGTAHPMPTALPQRLDSITQHYHLAVLGSERIAGRQAHHLSIKPLDSYRYRHDFWIDNASGLLLQSELVNGRGQSVERLLFTSLKFYDRLPEQLLKPETTGKGLALDGSIGADTGHDVNGTGRWVVTSLPPGFHQDMHRIHVISSKHSEVDHLVYSDGLATVSVFVEPDQGGNEGAPLGTSEIGAVHVYSATLDGHRITVVGEVPRATVELIGRSVRPTGQGDGG